MEEKEFLDLTKIEEILKDDELNRINGFGRWSTPVKEEDKMSKEEFEKLYEKSIMKNVVQNLLRYSVMDDKELLDFYKISDQDDLEWFIEEYSIFSGITYEVYEHPYNFQFNILEIPENKSKSGRIERYVAISFHVSGADLRGSYYKPFLCDDYAEDFIDYKYFYINNINNKFENSRCEKLCILGNGEVEIFIDGDIETDMLETVEHLPQLLEQEEIDAYIYFVEKNGDYAILALKEEIDISKLGLEKDHLSISLDLFRDKYLFVNLSDDYFLPKIMREYKYSETIASFIFLLDRFKDCDINITEIKEIDEGYNSKYLEVKMTVKTKDGKNIFIEIDKYYIHLSLNKDV